MQGQIQEVQVIIPDERMSEIGQLITEADVVFRSNENELENLKRSEWYKRLFDAITFQKKNEKVIVNNIKRLADLQKIIIQIMIIVAEKVECVSTIVRQNSKYIEEIFEQQEQITAEVSQMQDSIINLALKVKEKFDFIRCGYKIEKTIHDLNDANKFILVSALCEIAQGEDLTSKKESKDFINKVLNACGNYNTNQFDVDVLKDLSKDDSQIFYMVILDYIKYVKGECSFCSDTDKIIDNLSISASEKKELIERTDKLVSLAGKEILLNKYEKQEEDISIIMLDQDMFCNSSILEHDNKNENEKDKNYIAEDGRQIKFIRKSDDDNLLLTEMIEIKSDEKYIYENCSIHFQTMADCKGILIFKKCKIYFNETERKNNIKLSSGASIQIIDSEVHCSKLIEDDFITGNEINNVLIINSKFYECTHFIKFISAKEMKIENCFFENCFMCFVQINDGDKVEITNSEILFNTENSRHFSNHVFDINCDSVFINKIKVSSKVENFKSNYILSLRGNNNIISECDFNGTKDISLNYLIYGSHLEITNCKFYNCSKIINASETNINHCVFDGCENKLLSIKNSATKENNISYCTFKNLAVDKDCSIALYGYYMYSKGKYATKIENCIFEDCNIKNGYILECEINTFYSVDVYPVSVILNDCEFINCRTTNKDLKLIKEKSEYIPSSWMCVNPILVPLVLTRKRLKLLNEGKCVIGAVLIDNCNGLDKATELKEDNEN